MEFIQISKDEAVILKKAGAAVYATAFDNATPIRIVYPNIDPIAATWPSAKFYIEKTDEN